MNSLQQVINQFIQQVLSINILEKGLAESAEELLKESKAFCLSYLRSEIEVLDQAEFKRLVRVCETLYEIDSEQVKQISRYILNNCSGIRIWSEDPLYGLEQMTKLREHHLNGGKIVWHDFKKGEAENKTMEKVKNSVKLKPLYETYETLKAFDSLPVGRYHFPKRDARYRIFRAISEGGKAIGCIEQSFRLTTNKLTPSSYNEGYGEDGACTYHCTKEQASKGGITGTARGTIMHMSLEEKTVSL